MHFKADPLVASLWGGLVLLLTSGCSADEDAGPSDSSTTVSSASGAGSSSGPDTATSSGTTTGTTDPGTSADATVTSGGGGSTGLDEGSSSTGLPDTYYNNTIQPIFVANCGCHQPGPSGNMTAPFQNLSPGFSYNQIVGVPSEEAAGLDRVEPGDRDASYLWHKINGTQATVGGEGTKMPPLSVLDPENIALIGDWIDDGAPP